MGVVGFTVGWASVNFREGWALASVVTDETDGPTDAAAGAVVNGSTLYTLELYEKRELNGSKYSVFYPNEVLFEVPRMPLSLKMHPIRKTIFSIRLFNMKS